jgi:putative membrane protein
MSWLVAHLGPVLDLLLYSVLSTLILMLSLWIVVKVLPFSLRKELEEDQNTAIGIIMGAYIIGIAIIISAVLRS